MDELERDRVRVLRVGRSPVAVFHDEGSVSAVDNRCPHLGFPLHRGTVRDGVLTCHWHHAKFDLAGGCTFDPFADDAVPYPVKIERDVIWVGRRPVSRDLRSYHLNKLEQGLAHELQLVLAKSLMGLDGIAVPAEVLAAASSFGVRNRANGWSPGLSILTAVANIGAIVDHDDRPLGLFHGLIHVAADTAGPPPRFDLDPLLTTERRPERLSTWFREFCEVRADDAAERTLRAAVSVGMSQEQLAGMILAACTDHRFIDDGHVLDFANKSFELLDHIGWDRAGEVLASLIPAITTGQRMEETSAWRQPVDLAALVADYAARLEPPASERRVDRDGQQELAHLVLDGDPEATLGQIVALVNDGAACRDLSAAVAYAAALRLVHFPTTNDDSDWDTVHHVFTYANAVDQGLRRAPSLPLLRGLLDAAAAVHLERFLNIPKRPIPKPSGRTPKPADLLDAFDRQGNVDETAQLTMDLLAAGRDHEVVCALGHALVREDAAFHSYQVFEAGVRQHAILAPGEHAAHVLVGVARFLAARFPTVRSRRRTWQIAGRLRRGEPVFDVATTVDGAESQLFAD